MTITNQQAQQDIETDYLLRLQAYQQQIEAGLQALVASDQQPAELYDPVRYVLASQGKRLRPVLVLLAAEILDENTPQVLPIALAVEVFHNFTLVHDDIMDHAATRRGRPTVHTRWNESAAILSGDYLMALSYELLSRADVESLHGLMQTFHRMVALLCEGQALDEAFEVRSDVQVAEYMHMIACKTGALIEACLVLGAQAAGATALQVEQFEHIGKALGRAFQLQDDLLDLVAHDQRWGKKVGGDLIEGKKTYLLLRTLEEADPENRAWFARILEQGGLPPDDVAQARMRMSDLGILDETATLVAQEYQAAIEAVQFFPESTATRMLIWIIRKMMDRGY